MNFGIEALQTIQDLTKRLAVILRQLVKRIETLEQRPAGTTETPSNNFAGVPIGTVLEWYSDTSLPIGCIRAEGQAVSRTEFSDLFALWGTQFGVGDGSTTFNVIDRQAIIARGIGSQVIKGRTKTGPTLGEVREDQMQRITGHADIDAARAFTPNTGTASGPFTLQPAVNASSRSNAIAGGAPVSFRFDTSDSPDARTSDTTDGETRINEIGAIFIIKAQNLETATATESAVDSLNSRVSDVETKQNSQKFVQVVATQRTTRTDPGNADTSADDEVFCASGTGIRRRLNNIELSEGSSAYFENTINSNNEIVIKKPGTYLFEAHCVSRRTSAGDATIEVRDSLGNVLNFFKGPQNNIATGATTAGNTFIHVISGTFTITDPNGGLTSLSQFISTRTVGHSLGLFFLISGTFTDTCCLKVTLLRDA